MNFLDDQRHVPLVGERRLLAQPQAVVDGEGIDSHGEMLRVDLRKFLPTGVVSELMSKLGKYDCHTHV
jgi:hypothetical protein